MRFGVSSRGNSWVSMGPVGWLIAGPFLLAFYALYAAGWLAVFLVRLVVALVQAR